LSPAASANRIRKAAGASGESACSFVTRSIVT
jgi:hypothetical protein